jgi:hypothetical protein
MFFVPARRRYRSYEYPERYAPHGPLAVHEAEPDRAVVHILVANKMGGFTAAVVIENKFVLFLDALISTILDRVLVG